jgi:hypothetical protein
MGRLRGRGKIPTGDLKSFGQGRRSGECGFKVCTHFCQLNKSHRRKNALNLLLASNYDKASFICGKRAQTPLLHWG